MFQMSSTTKHQIDQAGPGAKDANGFIGKILVVDDETELKGVLVESLIAQGFEATGCSSGQDALSALRNENFDLLVTDLMMPEMNGIALLHAALEIDPDLVTLIMTGQGTIQTAVEAMKLGAFDYVLKPFRLTTLLPLLTRAMNMRRLSLENLQLREAVSIYELSQTIAFTLDPQTVLDKLADAALQQTAADEVSILMPTADGKELYVAAVRGEKRERLLGERLPFDKSVAGWVARERTPVLINGQIQDERFEASWPRTDICSSISVPMQVANKLIGVLNLNVVNKPRTFKNGQMKGLMILAGAAAAALESASLYTQVLRAEENYHSIFEHAVEGIFQTSPDGTFIRVNPAMGQLLGYSSPEELLTAGANLEHDLYADPGRRDEFSRILQKNDRLSGFEIELRKKDGSSVFLSESARAVRDESGRLLYYEGIAKDITERKRADEEESRLRAEIEQQRQRLDAIVANVPGVVFTAWGKPDSELHRTDFVSDHLKSMLGYSVSEWTSKPGFWLSIVHPDDRERVEREASIQFAAGKAGTREFRWLAKDGSVVWVSAHTIAILDDDGHPVGVRGVVTDITELKQLESALSTSEEQLRQSQKLEAIGQLAGGVAHDFNNLLTVIGGYSSILLNRMPEDSPHHMPIEEIKKASDRACGLTRQLLAFSRKQILQPKLLDLNDVVSDLDKMVRRLIGEDVDLFAITDPGLGKVKADPGQIEQVLLNLIVNARDAMPLGGKITIETSNVFISNDYAQGHAATPGSYVRLAVSDTGCGMSDEIKERIFEPFFTTKGAGKGTGLGLSTVYGIVKQSEGHIWLYSEPDNGTTFKIYLPRVSDAEEQEQVAIRAKPIPRGTETVLLVEDEDQVRDILTDILNDQGYRVFVAASGSEALDIARKNGVIHLMVTDVVMPQMSGRELSEKLAQYRPEMKVLYMSGYTDDAIVRHGLLDEKLHFLQKPFDSATVARKVRHVLDSQA
jgi:PAS domain S-box-containing protein